MNDQEYEKEIKAKNRKCLELFHKSLVEQKLSKKVIEKHCSNIEFYLNDFLNYYESTSMKEGAHMIHLFLGGWFIEKCMFANKTTINENATSIKKFYKCMLENNEIEREDYQALCDNIKENKEDWLMALESFDNGTYYSLF